MDQAKTAIILGATGLTGGILLEKLIADKRYRKIKIFSRNRVNIRSEKIEEYLIDLFELEKVEGLFTAEEVFCCIGSTKKKTPDKEIYRKVDFGIPATSAKLAKKNNIKTFLVISALGADENSNIFYNQVKGEMEGAVMEQNIKNTYILQPSLIAGQRDESRPMEYIFKKLMNVGNYLLVGGLRKYRSIEPETIVDAMIYLSNNEFESRKIESSSPSQIGFIKLSDSSSNSTSAITNPSFSPKNSSTSKVCLPAVTRYLYFSIFPGSHSFSNSRASSTSISFSHSNRSFLEFYS